MVKCRVVDKELVKTNTRSGDYYKPTLYCENSAGEILEVEVDGGIYKIIEVDNDIDINTWSILSEVVATEVKQ